MRIALFFALAFAASSIAGPPGYPFIAHVEVVDDKVVALYNMPQGSTLDYPVPEPGRIALWRHRGGLKDGEGRYTVVFVDGVPVLQERPEYLAEKAAADKSAADKAALEKAKEDQLAAKAAELKGALQDFSVGDATPVQVQKAVHYLLQRLGL